MQVRSHEEWHEDFADGGPPPGVGRTRFLPEEDGPWAVTEMECFICGDEWLDVHPADMKKSECPGCGYFLEMDEPGK